MEDVMDNVEKQDVNIDIEINQTSVLCIILAFLLPPLGVLVKKGLGIDFMLNILLTLLGFFPGIIHALFVILSK